MTIRNIRDFIEWEAAGGIVLFFMALLAILWVNSPLNTLYFSIVNASLIFWVNEGLMAIFFLLVGLELKREFLQGELTGIGKIALPGAAAFGGMLIPAFIYVAINSSSGITLKGWAIPVATDIAFALGVLSFFSKRIPLSLKFFLLTLAVFDDLGAIVIIGIFYTHEFSLVYFLSAGAVLLLLWRMGKKVDTFLPYLIFGVLLWFFILHSGIHASIAGVLLAMMIPLRSSSRESLPLLLVLEKRLHPWVAFFILPLFAFCNSGLSFEGLSGTIFQQPVVLGIAAGLFVGKQMGVLLFVWLMTKFGLARWPEGMTGLDMYGIALLCGIGFTMSLFLGTLAFQAEQTSYLTEVRLGVFLGSVLSALSGSLVLQLAYLQKRKRRFFV